MVFFTTFVDTKDLSMSFLVNPDKHPYSDVFNGSAP
jgi:hypothetical protein